MADITIDDMHLQVLEHELQVARLRLKMKKMTEGKPTGTPARAPASAPAWLTKKPLVTSPPISGGVSAAEQEVTYPAPERPSSSLDGGASWGAEATNEGWATVAGTRQITPRNSSSGESQHEFSPEVIRLVNAKINAAARHNNNHPHTCKSKCRFGTECNKIPGTCCAAHDIDITTADGKPLVIQAEQVAGIARGYTRAQTVPRNYKTQMCRNIQEGRTCPYDESCLYAHSDDEIRTLHTMTAEERVAAQREHKKGTTTLCTEEDCNHDECEQPHLKQ